MPIASRVAVLSGPYLPESRDLFDRMTTTPTARRCALVDSTIRRLKGAGLWEGHFGACAAHAEQAGLLSWVGSDGDMTAVNSPTFTADRGFTGDGASAYLTMSPDVDNLGIGGQNDISVSVWTRVSDAENPAVLDANGSTAQLRIIPRLSGDVFRSRCNAASNGDETNADAAGHFAISRSASANYQTYVDGALLSTETVNSVALPDAPLRLLTSANITFSTNEVAWWSIRPAMSAAKVAAEYTIVNDHLAAIGAV